MPITVEKISRVTIQGRTEGLPEATSQLKSLAAAQAGVAVASDRSTRSTVSLEAAMNKVQRTFDISYRQTQDLERITRQLDAARNQGLIDLQRQNQLLDLVNDKFNAVKTSSAGAAAGLTGAAKGAQLSAGQMQNLSYQIHDIASGLLMGQSPFMIMAQQGSQITQVFGEGTGVRGMLKALGSSLLTYVSNPLTLAVLGFGLAAQAADSLFHAIINGGSSAEDVLKRNKELGDEIKNAFTDAGKAAQQLNLISLQGMKLAQEAKAEQLKSLTQGSLTGLGGAFQTLNSLAGANTGNNVGNMIESFMASVKAGTGDVGKFNTDISDLLSKLSATNPEWRKFYLEIKEAIDPALKFNDQLAEANARIAYLAGTASDLQKQLIGVADGFDKAADSAKSFIEQGALAGLSPVDQAIARIHQQAQDLKTTLAKALPASPSAGQQATYDSTLGSIGLSEQQQVAAALKNAATKADAKGVNAYGAAVKSLKDETSALQDQAAAFGMTSQQADFFLKKQQLINVANANGIPIDKTLTDSIDGLAAKYAEADAIIKKFNDRQQAAQFLAQGLYDAFIQWASGSESASKAIADLAKQLAMAVVQAELLGSGPLAGILGTSGTNGGILTQVASAAVGAITGSNSTSSILAQLWHTGGIVGDGGSSSRMVAMSIFQNAPRMHEGGRVPLAHDEFPAILQRGEGVISRAQMAAGGGGQAPIINITVEKGTEVKSQKTSTEGGRSMAKIVVGLVKDDMARGGFDTLLGGRTNRGAYRPG